MKKTAEKSLELFRRASNRIVGGVNSPARAFRAVGMSPLFIERAKGSRIWDADGREYIDYVGSWGAMILGHAPSEVLLRVEKVIKNGTSFGAPTSLEVDLAEKIYSFMPSMELIRMVNSGTESTLSAIRLARGYTGRDKIVKLEGCYHGHGDSFLIRAGSGLLSLGEPDSTGIPKSIAQETLVGQFNHIDSIQELFQKEKNIAAVITEPVLGNAGCIPPKCSSKSSEKNSQKHFLRELRELCDQEGSLFILDEVMTGFRLSYGRGAQDLYGVEPDLTCLGKIIGGGFPVGAYGGKKEIMNLVSPMGSVYQAGTLSGNPVAMAAGSKTLEILARSGMYSELERKSKLLEDGIRDNLKKLGLNYALNRVDSMFCLFFTDCEVFDFSSAKSSNTQIFARYFQEMLKEGIYLPPSQFESFFLSLAHSEEDIEKTLKAQYKALQSISLS